MTELPAPIDPGRLDTLIELAVQEDTHPGGDISSQVACVDPQVEAAFAIVFRQEGVLAGAALLGYLLNRLAPEARLAGPLREDGSLVAAGESVGTVVGPLAAILRIERILLNFLQRLCGVASLTRCYVEQTAGTGAKIYDTRKTIPAWRDLDKYAVRCGGGQNHRHGLHEAVLLKDNHLAGVPADRLGSELVEILRRARRLEPAPAFVEVEVDSLDQLVQAFGVCRAGPDRLGIDVLLLDNFSIDDLRMAVRLRTEHGLDGVVELEASGGIRLETVRAVAQTGVDRISVGALTHSAAAMDIGLDRIR